MQTVAYPGALHTAPPNCLPLREAFEGQLMEVLPGLRALAWKLSRNDADSDDLVQETVAKALSAYRTFQMGTNLKAWTSTILRNQRMNEQRKLAARTEVVTDPSTLRHSVQADQEDRVELNETLDAMAGLKSVHREVLTLVRVMGYEYEQAAKLMACPVGTIKSRLSRADAALRAAIDRPS